MATVYYKGAALSTNSKAYELFQERNKSPQHEKALQKHLDEVHSAYVASAFGGDKEAYKSWKEKQNSSTELCTQTEQGIK